VFTFDDEEYWQIKLGRFNLIVVPLFTACYLSLVSVFFCVCSLPKSDLAQVQNKRKNE